MPRTALTSPFCFNLVSLSSLFNRFNESKEVLESVLYSPELDGVCALAHPSLWHIRGSILNRSSWSAQVSVLVLANKSDKGSTEALEALKVGGVLHSCTHV